MRGGTGNSELTSAVGLTGGLGSAYSTPGELVLGFCSSLSYHFDHGIGIPPSSPTFLDRVDFGLLPPDSKWGSSVRRARAYHLFRAVITAHVGRFSFDNSVRSLRCQREP